MQMLSSRWADASRRQPCLRLQTSDKFNETQGELSSVCLKTGSIFFPQRCVSGVMIVAVHKWREQKKPMFFLILIILISDRLSMQILFYDAAASFFPSGVIPWSWWTLLIIFIFLFFLHWKIAPSYTNRGIILFAECDNRTTAPLTDSSPLKKVWSGSSPDRENLLLLQRPLSGAKHLWVSVSPRSADAMAGRHRSAEPTVK